MSPTTEKDGFDHLIFYFYQPNLAIKRFFAANCVP
jgi:hypothetical protein